VRRRRKGWAAAGPAYSVYCVVQRVLCRQAHSLFFFDNILWLTIVFRQTELLKDLDKIFRVGSLWDKDKAN